MYVVHIAFSNGSFERRPSASSTPSGKHSTIDAAAMNTLIMNPPHSSQPSTPASSINSTTGTAAMASTNSALTDVGQLLIIRPAVKPIDAADDGTRDHDGHGDPRTDAARQRQQQCDADEQGPEPDDELSRRGDGHRCGARRTCRRVVVER